MKKEITISYWQCSECKNDLSAYEHECDGCNVKLCDHGTTILRWGNPNQDQDALGLCPNCVVPFAQLWNNYEKGEKNVPSL